MSERRTRRELKARSLIAGQMPELRLGNTFVKSDTGEIRSENGATHLEPKSMAVLMYLLERHSQVVSREELLDAVWPGVHVGDDSLTAAIIKIRRALGDDARNPVHIETIPKRGYRLISPMGGEDEDGGNSSPEAKTGPPPVRPVRKYAPLAAALLAAIGILHFVGFSGAPAPAPDPGTDFVSGSTVIDVTPFTNVSGDPGQEYLALGISDTILNDLSHHSGFSIRQVMDGTRPKTPADYVLQGSVARVGERLRIVARLLSGSDGEVLRALRFDRDFDELLAIEDEIREDVLTEITGSITQEDKSRQARGYTDSVAAYDLFLRAQSHLLIRTAPTNSTARDLYLRAIAEDETFARAYGGLALSYAAEYRNGWAANDAEVLEDAMRFAKSAIEIAPELPEQHWVIGYVLTQQRHYQEAETHLNRAIEITPGFADAYALLGGIATYKGTPASTIPLLREALRINPDAGYLYFLLLARAYYFLGDYQQAHINLSEALGRNPENIETRLYLAATLLHLDRPDEAEWEAVEVLGLEPEFNLDAWSETYPMIRGNQLDGLLADLRSSGLT